MKRIDRLILKSFIGPLILTFAIAVFVLLMQFVWKYIDDMVGKGLEFKVLAELLFYASATFVPMALPIATLFASIMTMGNFGEKYELVAMKAGGISIRRVMIPMALLTLMVTCVGFYFANNVMPVAMFKYKSTLYDVTRKKPALNIRPSEYYSEIDGYVIRINEKDPDGRTLRDITIYDHTKGITETTVIVAEKGIMQVSPDERYLMFTLYNGNTYTELSEGENAESRPLTSIGFKEQMITFDLSSFAFNKSDGDFYNGNYQMMNVRQLDTTTQLLSRKLEERHKEYQSNINGKFPYFNAYKESLKNNKRLKGRDRFAEEYDKKMKVNKARYCNMARTTAILVSEEINVYDQTFKAEREFLNRHYIEWHRKYTLSIACLVLFLIGAPFGSIVRKGGLGLPLVASVLFFVLYYVIGMIAEKAVRESAIGPIGMWYSTFILIPIGVLLTLQATTDSSFFDAAMWKKKYDQKIKPHMAHLLKKLPISKHKEKNY